MGLLYVEYTYINNLMPHTVCSVVCSVLLLGIEYAAYQHNLMIFSRRLTMRSISSYSFTQSDSVYLPLSLSLSLLSNIRLILLLNAFYMNCICVFVVYHWLAIPLSQLLLYQLNR